MEDKNKKGSVCVCASYSSIASIYEGHSTGGQEMGKDFETNASYHKR